MLEISLWEDPWNGLFHGHLGQVPASVLQSRDMERQLSGPMQDITDIDRQVIESIDMRYMNTTEVECKDGHHLEPAFERHVREVTEKSIGDLCGVSLTYVRTGEISKVRRRRIR